MANEYEGFREAETRNKLESLIEAASYNGEDASIYKEILRNMDDQYQEMGA